MAARPREAYTRPPSPKHPYPVETRMSCGSVPTTNKVYNHIIDILVPQDHNRRSTYTTCGSVKPTPSFRVPHGPEWCRSKRPSPRPYTPTHMDHRNALLRGPSHLSMQLQVRSRVRSAICSQDTRRSGRDTAIRACTSCSRRALAPRQWREQHQHAHCDHHMRRSLLSRTAARTRTLGSPRLCV